MTVTVEDWCDVGERARDLGCNEPTGVALLPRNFVTANCASDLVHEDSSATVRKLLKDAGVDETPLERPGEAFPAVVEQSVDWVGPIVFMSSAVLSQQSEVIATAITAVKNYLELLLAGRADTSRVKLDVVVDKPKSKTSKRLHYEGPVSGLSKLEEAIKKVVDE